MRRSTLLLLIVLAAAFLLEAGPSPADGGVVQLRAISGPFQITLFRSPALLRAGPLELSVMVQERETGRPLLDAEVWVRLEPPGGRGPTLRVPARREDATNRLLHTARLELAEPGLWSLNVRVDHEAVSREFQTSLRVAPPRPPWISFWPYFAFPPLAIALFALHQWLRHRQSARP